MSDNDEHENAAPWERPLEPDHPMVVEGGVVPGDTSLMFRCMCEELLQLGYAPETLQAMSRDPGYQALYAARTWLGSEATDRLFAETVARIGRHRIAFSEAPPPEDTADTQVERARPLVLTMDGVPLDVLSGGDIS